MCLKENSSAVSNELFERFPLLPLLSHFIAQISALENRYNSQNFFSLNVPPQPTLNKNSSSYLLVVASFVTQLDSYYLNQVGSYP